MGGSGPKKNRSLNREQRRPNAPAQRRPVPRAAHTTKGFPSSQADFTSLGDASDAAALDLTSPAVRHVDSSEVAWLKHELKVQGQHLERKREEVCV